MITRSLKTSMTALAAVAALSFAVAGCGSSDDDTAGDTPTPSTTPTSTDTGAAAPALDLVSDGTLTVCSDVPYAPFEDFDKSSSVGFKGFDVDMVQYAADKLGLGLKILDEDFDGLQSGLTLNAGTCDVVASAMTITDDRAKNLDFTESYYNSEQSLLVPDDSSITGIADLAGKNVGVQKGTTGKQYAKDNAKGATITDFPSDAELFQALKAGQIDAILQDYPVNKVHEAAGGYKVVEEYDTGEHYGMAVKKGNTGLVDALNGAIDAMKADGTYATDYEKWFNAAPPAE
jgi:polar amino acid transport system substrate-binding protein